MTTALPPGVNPATASLDQMMQYYHLTGTPGVAGLSPSALSPNTPMVWQFAALPPVGHDFSSDTLPAEEMQYYAHNPSKTRRRGAPLPAAASIAQFDKLSPAQQRAWAGWLALAGYAGSTAGDLKNIQSYIDNAPLGSVRQAFEYLIKDASERFSKNGEKVSPTQILKQQIDYRLGSMGINWNGRFDSLYAPNRNPNKGPRLNPQLFNGAGGNPVALQHLLTQFDRESPEQQRKTAGLLALAGYAGTTAADLKNVQSFMDTAPLSAVRGAYENLLQDAAARYSQGGQKLSPDQLLRQALGYRLKSLGVKWNGTYGSLFNDKNKFDLSQLAGGAALTPQIGDTRTITSHNNTLDIMDPNDARDMTRVMLQNELGRDPTQAEYSDFLAMLNHAERANPSQSTSKAKYTYTKGFGWRETGVNTTTQQGISSGGLEQLAYEKAKQMPDYATWQAVGTYAPALFSALGATVPGV